MTIRHSKTEVPFVVMKDFAKANIAADCQVFKFILRINAPRQYVRSGKQNDLTSCNLTTSSTYLFTLYKYIAL